VSRRNFIGKIQIGGRQSGVSLVEIMVALTAGLLLTVTVGQIYLANKQTYRLQEAQSRLQEDGRYALDILTRNIRLAGYKTIPWSTGTAAFPKAAGTGTTVPDFGKAGQIVTGLYGSAAAPATDKLSVRFQGASDAAGTPDETVLDCSGHKLGASVLAVNTLAVDTAENELECTATNLTTNPTTGGTLTQPALSGFGNFQVWYGVDTDADRTANQYVTASAVTNWADVVSVRISFELVSGEDNITVAPETYTFNGRSYTDRRLRRRFSITIALRNRLP
jgi:type IV pilus assembly protein PilW